MFIVIQMVTVPLKKINCGTRGQSKSQTTQTNYAGIQQQGYYSINI
jgi:hypothetical protein